MSQNIGRFLNHRLGCNLDMKMSFMTIFFNVDCPSSTKIFPVIVVDQSG